MFADEYCHFQKVSQKFKQTVAVSLLLAGEEILAKRMELYEMRPIRARLTTILKLSPMNEFETRLFIEILLENAETLYNSNWFDESE